MRKMQHGNDAGEHRLLVTRFVKGDYIMRKGEAATFLSILLQGELGVRIGKGGGFPRRLHKGSLFGERGMFNAGNLRAADVIVLSFFDHGASTVGLINASSFDIVKPGARLVLFVGGHCFPKGFFKFNFGRSS